ncbi:MAG: hypothetical protein O2992_07255 [Gemmatimonadetes bacterium]|nr:hypothetical protein [Gemmatimonadota bacterium]
MNTRGVGKRFMVAALTGLALGCTKEADAPQSATVIVEASATQGLLLIVSTRFEVPTGGQVAYANVDTVQVTGNYTETYALNSEARFSAILLNETEAIEVVRLSVLIDNNVQYDEAATMGMGGFLQFLYRFQFDGLGL